MRKSAVNTLVSVLMINAQGIMISVQGHDYFLSYNRIPWMQDAPIRSVLNVRMSGPEAIEWPDLDVDLEIDSLRHPERYPLLIKRNELDYVYAYRFGLFVPCGILILSAQRKSRCAIQE